MTASKNTPSKVHYLNLLNQPAETASGDLEHRIHDLAQGLERLEKEISGQLKRIEKGLEGKKSKNFKNGDRLYRELENIKSRFDVQLDEIATALHLSLKPKVQERESLAQRLKKILHTTGLFPQKTEEIHTRSEMEEEVDPFGYDAAFEKKLKPFFDFFYYRYWRVNTFGLENIPAKGRALLVSNHSGTLPYDGSMIRLAVTNDHPSQRDVRFLVEDFVYYLPFLGTYMYRIGGVRASPENAERLLNMDHLVAVFPEGVKGIGKNYSQRYHLQRFGRGGFIKLAIRTNSPIIPVAVIGAEEIHPMLLKSSLLAKPLGIPYIPITPTFPLLGPLGLIPFPSKWSIHFGKPIDLGKYGKKTLEDELEIHKLSERVRQTIQKMVTEALKQRKSVWWG